MGVFVSRVLDVGGVSDARRRLGNDGTLHFMLDNPLAWRLCSSCEEEFDKDRYRAAHN